MKHVIIRCHLQLFTDTLELSRWSKEPHCWLWLVNPTLSPHGRFFFDTWKAEKVNSVCICITDTICTTLKNCLTDENVEVISPLPGELEVSAYPFFIPIILVVKDSLIQYLQARVTHAVFIQWPLTTTHLQLQRCLTHTGLLAFSSVSGPPAVPLDVRRISCQSCNKTVKRFHSARCISEDHGLHELNGAAAFRENFTLGILTLFTSFKDVC